MATTNCSSGLDHSFFHRNLKRYLSNAIAAHSSQCYTTLIHEEMNLKERSFWKKNGAWRKQTNSVDSFIDGLMLSVCSSY